MPDNPIHTFFQMLGGNIPDQLSLGGYRWFEVALYWVLLIGSLTIAYANWRMDETQRTGTHISIYAMRLVSAGMWYLGTLWKLPLPVSGGFKFWLENTVKYSSFHVHASIMQVFLDHIALVQPLVFLLETALAVSLMLGFLHMSSEQRSRDIPCRCFPIPAFRQPRDDRMPCRGRRTAQAPALGRTA